ncbi:hypothetical protein [Streptomyces sp. H34-S4]|uniref:hypothetical protein n=1 Tax=Streptomyces sp. H34-S4 TaxID=2996463 RepID=UPI00226E769D|nr:hypothetical protein [Streptomyces sp. H34-S4]MCY0935785.1 hypothetical protein [Streptomyces sp. H34-S4]
MDGGWVLRLFVAFRHPAETAEEFRDAFSLAAVADLTIAAAAVLAVLFVRRLTALQQVKAFQGPNATV